MDIGLVLPEFTESDLKLARQMGVTDIIGAASAEMRTGPEQEFRALLAQTKQVEDAGLKLSVIRAGVRISDRVKLGLPGRDEDIENWCRLLRAIGAVGIPIVCYSWMPGFNWLRTSRTTRVRGDALATSYEHALMQLAPSTDAAPVTEEQLWEGLKHFLRAVVPIAEEVNVQLAMHPDDPPISPIGGGGRILTSVENLQRLIDLVPSPVNGITFCQGCFAEIGVDIPKAIKQFGTQGKLFFAHFRDVRGTAESFCETFHDDGDTDMYEAMKAYYDVGFQGPMCPDHAPTMEGDDNSRPGYTMLGKLFAVGYMKGLLEAVEKTR